MKENKKRFKRLKVSMVLMVLALMTSCVVGGTYAKYVHSGRGGDGARIAKFGVVIKANGEMFSKSYASEQARERETVMSVLSTDSVIAPGTSGRMISMTVSGNPEVSIGVKYVGELYLNGWEVINDKQEKEFYCPITIIIGDKEIAGTSFESAEKFKAAVEEEIGNYSAEYAVDTFSAEGLSNKNISVPSVSWRWDFNGNDEYDTYLGDQACGATQDVSTIALYIQTTIAQID